MKKVTIYRLGKSIRTRKVDSKVAVFVGAKRYGSTTIYRFTTREKYLEVAANTTWSRWKNKRVYETLREIEFNEVDVKGNHTARASYAIPEKKNTRYYIDIVALKFEYEIAVTEIPDFGAVDCGIEYYRLDESIYNGGKDRVTKLKFKK
jgi:hypothetical protein